MSYNNWKLMDKIDVAVRTGTGKYDFTGYIVEHGDEKALESAKDWAREREYDREKREYTKIYEPEVHTFENKGFIAKILDSAGGSSQGGRLSFWRCEIEKDGVKFTIGVNDAVLADLIRSSDLSNGLVEQKVMFARKSGQPGLIHEGMQSYQDAVADMGHKAAMKSAKKTSKWEIGGIYQTITQTDICIGEVWDTMEEYEEANNGYRWASYRRISLRKTENPKKVMAWLKLYRSNELPETLEAALKGEIKSGYVFFYAGKPPARAKTGQLEVKDTDKKLIDKLLLSRDESRYTRKLKK